MLCGLTALQAILLRPVRVQGGQSAINSQHLACDEVVLWSQEELQGGGDLRKAQHGTSTAVSCVSVHNTCCPEQQAAGCGVLSSYLLGFCQLLERMHLLAGLQHLVLVSELPADTSTHAHMPHKLCGLSVDLLQPPAHAHTCVLATCGRVIRMLAEHDTPLCRSLHPGRAAPGTTAAARLAPPTTTHLVCGVRVSPGATQLTRMLCWLYVAAALRARPVCSTHPPANTQQSGSRDDCLTAVTKPVVGSSTANNQIWAALGQDTREPAVAHHHH